MRAILDMRTRKVLRLPGSIATCNRTYAMLQIERDKMRQVCIATVGRVPAMRDYRLAICELTTSRHIGDTVPEGEFTIIHEEKQ